MHNLVFACILRFLCFYVFLQRFVSRAIPEMPGPLACSRIFCFPALRAGPCILHMYSCTLFACLRV
jgi:hypothetical protein